MNLFDKNPQSGAVFSDCKKYRYRLWRIWDDSKPKILFVMLNPSTADEKKNDPTIRRCIGYAKAWGYGGLYVGNIFAYRATKPADMKREEHPAGHENDWHLKEMARKCERVILAWGNHGSHLDRCEEVVKLFDEPECLDITNQGQPKHPLYLRKTLKPQRYGVADDALV